ncbi:MAG: DNA-directed RNA polymerase subunit omega [Actinobacteria bacterium]|nr:DNA-directed RNA polymerase subunit omega [Actinomycetota bacterium]
MMDPPIEILMDKVNSRFALVTVSARRARQINSYFNQLGEGLGAIVPPQVASVSRKPLSIALEEIVSEKITFTPLSEDDKVPADDSVAASPVAEVVAEEPDAEGQD